MRLTSANYVEGAEVGVASIEGGDLAPRLGERIAHLRQRRGWSRVELAQRLAVQRDRLAKWELGKNLPPVEMLAPLARTLGASVDELLTGEAPVDAPLTQAQWQEMALYVGALHRMVRESKLAVFLPGDEAAAAGADLGRRAGRAADPLDA